MAKAADRDGNEYNARFRSMCRALFVEYRSIPGILRELKRRGYKHPPNYKTLTRWRNDENWGDDLKKMDEITGAGVVAEDPLEALILEVDAVRKVARQRIMVVDPKSKKLTIKATDPQDLYAYKGMAETQAKLIDIQRRFKKDAEGAVPAEVILRALKRHPKLARILDDPKVVGELREIARDEMQQTLMKEARLG